MSAAHQTPEPATDAIRADICIIGAGSGGLSVAAGAAQLGVRTVLVEKGRMGGDCLNYGCVPSKSMIAAAAKAHAMETAGPFGVTPHPPGADFARVREHVRHVIAQIEPNDSVERFEGLGATVIAAAARFTGPDTVQAGKTRITARRFVIATGSAPAIPPITGLDAVPFFTNETIFDNDVRPERLIVIGGGPIGCELSQAHRRLGAQVTLIQSHRVLPKDDPELAAVVLDALRRDGVDVLENSKVNSVSTDAQGRISVHVGGGEDAQRTVEGSHLLVAAGRRPSVSGLGLEAAGITFSPRGIDVDHRLRTSNRRVFAIGDVTGGLQFTHVASYHAGIVVRNALFRVPARARHDAVPWVTYTDPELAHVGLTEEAARAARVFRSVIRWPLAENDRAQAERRTQGLIKAVTGRRGRILGASITAPHAGELILPWVLAITQGLKIGAMAGFIAPYPTLGEISKRVAGAYYTPTLFSPRTKRIVRFLGKFG